MILNEVEIKESYQLNYNIIACLYFTFVYAFLFKI